jgi:CRP/FNR family transcriptional regulator, anaerobic regulatory protein
MVGDQEAIYSREIPSTLFGSRKQFVLAEAEQREIGQLGRRIDFLAGATIFKQGEPKAAVYALTEGIAVRYRMRVGGRKQIVGFGLPGDLLNSAFADRHTCSVDVISQAKTCQFQRRPFLTFLETHPKTLRESLETFSHEIDAAHEHILLLGRGTAEEKFVEFILSWRARIGRRGALANLVPLPMSRRDIADCLGLTIETVSRLVAKLARENVVRVIPEGLQLMGPIERPLLFERSYKAITQQRSKHTSNCGIRRYVGSKT